MVSEPSPHASTTSTMISITTEGGPRPARDWDAMNQDEKARIERKLDEILEMMRSRSASPSTTPAAPTSAAAPALGVGSPSSGPGSSATSGGSPVVPDARLVLAMDTTSLGAPPPTRCSTESPSCGAIESRPAFDSATAPSDTLDFISVFVATAARDGALGREAISATAIQATCLKVDTHKLFEERPPQIKFEGEAWSQRLQLKPPWPSVTLISRGNGISSIGYQGPSVNCCLRWASEQEKLLFYSAYGQSAFVFVSALHVLKEIPAIVVMMRRKTHDIGVRRFSKPIPSQWAWSLPAPHIPQRRPPELEDARAPLPLPMQRPSLVCDVEAAQQNLCSPYEDMTPASNPLMLSGIRSTSRGYILRNVLCSPSGIGCLDVAFVRLKRCWSVIQCVQQSTAIFEISLGPERHRAGFSMQDLVQDAALKEFWRSAAPCFLMLNLLAEKPNYMVIMASWESGYKLFTIPFLIWRTSAARIPNSLAQFQSKVAGPLYHSSNYCSVALIGLQVPGNLITQGWIYEAHKDNNYIKLSPSDHCQDGTNFTVEQLSYPAVECNASDAFHCGGANHARQQLFKKKVGGVASIPIFLDGKGLASYLCGTCALNPRMQISFEAWCTCVLPMCTDMRMDKAKGNGELTQWLASNLFVECLHSNNCGSDISSIKSFQEVNTLFCFVPVELDGETNQHWKIPWDPGGSMFALSSSHKWWTTPELTYLHCSKHRRWLSVLWAYASRIWLVAWDMDDLELSTGCSQAPFQGGRNATNCAAFFDQVHINHDYYLASVNQVPVSYDFYLDQTYYFDPAYDGLKYYSEDCLGNPSKLNEVHAPWDPGKLALCYPSKASAWGQAEFQGGRNVRTLDPLPLLGLVSWASNDGPGPSGDLQERLATNIREEAAMNSSRWITNGRRLSSPSPVFPLFPNLRLSFSDSPLPC